MVYGVIKNFELALKTRGGWTGLLRHMYTNGDYPFKIGTLMGKDAAGNKYYENRSDYPFGQHRWVEPGDIHNFDSSSIPPEWHGWMTSQNDVVPSQEDEYFEKAKANILPTESNVDTPVDHAVGHQERYFNFHHLHNQTLVRSRGYGIGNPVVGLPPNVKDGYYTQPGSPYNESTRKVKTYIGDLDEDLPETDVPHRKYTSLKWADRLRTIEEKEAIERKRMESAVKASQDDKIIAEAMRMKRVRGRGRGTVFAA